MAVKHPGAGQGRDGAALCLLAGIFALAELGLGLVVGDYMARGRAEMTLFLAWRPWLLLIAGIAIARWPPRERVIGYAAALLLATACEALLALLLGGGPGLGGEIARGLLAGLLMAALVEASFRVAGMVGGRAWRLLGFLIAAGLLIAPPLQRSLDSVALLRPPVIVQADIPVGLLTGLPIIWGERPGDGPAQVYRQLADAFHLMTFDVVTPAALDRIAILVAAQPRPMAPAQLAAIDAWVQRGGRALLFTDPDLHWSGTHDIPNGQALAPLLAHWRVAVVPAAHGVDVIDLPERLAVDAPGRIAAPHCIIRASGLIADCTIGKGRTVIVADADLLHDRLWVGDGPLGATRAARAADNGTILISLVDELAERPRERSTDRVAWARYSDSWRVAFGFSPAIVVLIVALGLLRRRPG